MSISSEACYSRAYLLSALVNGVMPILIVCAAFFLIVLFTRRWLPDDLRPSAPGLSAGFASIGGAIGLFTGSSRDPVVSAMLPAFIALVTIFVSYVLDADKARPYRPLVPTLLLAIVISSVFATYYSSSARNVREEWERELDLYADQFKEQQVAIVRKLFEKAVDDGKLNRDLMAQIFGGPPSALPAPNLLSIDCPRPGRQPS